MKFALQLALDDTDACVGMQRFKIGDQQNGLRLAFKFGQLGEPIHDIFAGDFAGRIAFVQFKLKGCKIISGVFFGGLLAFILRYLASERFLFYRDTRLALVRDSVIQFINVEHRYFLFCPGFKTKPRTGLLAAGVFKRLKLPNLFYSHYGCGSLPK